MKTRTLQWVLLRDLDKWLACGWVLIPANAPMHHHEYALLMEWLCDCPPVVPGKGEKELR